MRLGFPGRTGEPNHERAREWMSSYLDGQLPSSDARLLELHLQGCGQCREELGALRMTRQLLRAMPTPRLPRSFTLEAAPERVRLPGSFFFLRTATGIATTAFLALFAASAVLPMAGAPMAGVTARGPSAYQAQQERPQAAPTARASAAQQQDRLAPAAEAVGAAAPADRSKAVAPMAAAAPTMAPSAAPGTSGAPAPAAVPAAPAVRAATPASAAPAAGGAVPPAPAAPPEPAPTQAPAAALAAAPQAAEEPTAPASKRAEADASAEQQPAAAAPAPIPTREPTALPAPTLDTSQEKLGDASDAMSREADKSNTSALEQTRQPASPASPEVVPTSQQNGAQLSIMWLLQAISGGLAAILAVATGGVWWTHRRRNR